VPEAAGFHLFVERPLTLGTGEDVLLLDDPPIDLIWHSLLSYVFRIVKVAGFAWRMVSYKAEPTRTCPRSLRLAAPDIA
jgi:hypothetical protein